MAAVWIIAGLVAVLGSCMKFRFELLNYTSFLPDFIHFLFVLPFNHRCVVLVYIDKNCPWNSVSSPW